MGRRPPKCCLARADGLTARASVIRTHSAPKNTATSTIRGEQTGTSCARYSPWCDARIGERSAETVTDRGDVVEATPGSNRGLPYSNTPVLSGRAGVARDKVDVKMGYIVAEHEAVDVLCTFAVLECAGKIVGEHPKSGSFLVGQFPQADDVAFGFDHQVPEVHVGQVGRENMTGIHQLILMDDPTRRGRPLCVFVADEAVLVRQGFTSN